MDFITSIFNKINAYSAQNQIIAGVISLYGLGVLTFLLKNVPKDILNFIIKQATTTVQIGNIDISYYKLMKLLESSSIVNKLRIIKFYNGCFGNSEKIIKGIGIGNHLIYYRKKIIKIQISSKESSYDKQEKLEIILTKFGRSHNVFDEIRLELESDDLSINDTSNEVEIYHYHNDWWQYVTEQKHRNINTVFLNKNKKDELICVIENFISNEKWYIQKGIPYQLGILIYGIPGSGKTSLIRSIASLFNKNIAIVDTYNLKRSLSKIPKNSIIVIEDIDSYHNTHDRSNLDNLISNNNKEEENIIKKNNSENDLFSFLGSEGLSDLLNSIDGLISIHGRIMIVTTNHIEKLDTALLRPGRIDYKLEMSYISINEFIEFLTLFFEKDFSHLKTKKIKNTTIAELQNEYMINKDENIFINKYTYE